MNVIEIDNVVKVLVIWDSSVIIIVIFDFLNDFFYVIIFLILDNFENQVKVNIQDYFDHENEFYSTVNFSKNIYLLIYYL